MVATGSPGASGVLPTTRAPFAPRIVCFTSAKGGSGKTILAASTAWVLMQAGRRVVVLDTDFSTRGLSLFLLEALTLSDPDSRPENCLADALLGNIPVDHIRPLVVVQKRGTFSIILPNSDFRQGGGCCRALCWNLLGAVSGRIRISDQAARSIGVSASFWLSVCHPSTLLMVI